MSEGFYFLWCWKWVLQRGNCSKVFLLCMWVYHHVKDLKTCHFASYSDHMEISGTISIVQIMLP